METKLYLTRHLQRIDDGSESSREQAVRWNLTDSKNPNFIINPYLSDYADRHVDLVVRKLPKIDVIVTSPFLRCMQTSLKIFNKLKESGSAIQTIYVDFGLSEIVEEYNFYTLTEPKLNIQSIYDFSLQQLTLEQQSLFTVMDPTPSIIEFENDEQYELRIKSTLLQIYRTFIGLNVLIVSHAYSYKPIAGRELRYTDVFELEPSSYIIERTFESGHPIQSTTTTGLNSSSGASGQTSVSSDAEYRKKYLKYKEKYLRFKNKN